MWLSVGLVRTGVSEERIAFIFRVEKSASSLLPPAHDGSSLADFSTLKMEAKRGFTQDLHCATSQKTAFFIVTAVKTSILLSHLFALTVLVHQQLCYYITVVVCLLLLFMLVGEKAE
jgi:hypothetical protein